MEHNTQESFAFGLEFQEKNVEKSFYQNTPPRTERRGIACLSHFQFVLSFYSFLNNVP